jgi:cytochrome b
MTNVDNTIETGGARPPGTVKVWGLFIRAFHWSLVALFVVAYVTGDEIERVHIAAGCAIAGVIVLRLGWGVLGPRHARFSTFVRTPHEVFA